MDEQQHDEIRRGFNAGYLLEKLNPELAKKLRSSINDQKNPFFLGMVKGAEQYNQESFFDSPPPGIPDKIEALDLENLPDDRSQETSSNRDQQFEP